MQALVECKCNIKETVRNNIKVKDISIINMDDEYNNKYKNVEDGHFSIVYDHIHTQTHTHTYINRSGMKIIRQSTYLHNNIGRMRWNSFGKKNNNYFN